MERKNEKHFNIFTELITKTHNFFLNILIFQEIFHFHQINFFLSQSPIPHPQSGRFQNAPSLSSRFWRLPSFFGFTVWSDDDDDYSRISTTHTFTRADPSDGDGDVVYVYNFIVFHVVNKISFEQYGNFNIL